MRPLRPSVFSAFAALLGSAALLAGCCANEPCERDDSLEDAITFRFKIGNPTQDPTGFKLAEVDSVRLVRYRLPVTDPQSGITTPEGRPDTVLLVRTGRGRGADTTSIAATPIHIANASPFAISGTQRVNAYRYLVLLPNSRRRTPAVRYRFDFTDVQLKGQFEAEGCCTYYKNESKTANLVVYKLDAKGDFLVSTQSKVDLKQPVELSRPQ